MNDAVNFDLVPYWIGVWYDSITGEQSAVGYQSEAELADAVAFFKELDESWVLNRAVKVEV